jgi:hypothetical protein
MLALVYEPAVTAGVEMSAVQNTVQTFQVEKTEVHREDMELKRD